jgi:hypothetical protein
MALRLTSAIVDGSRRVLTRTGGILFVVLLVHEALLVTSLNTAVTAADPTAAGDVIGLTLPVSGTVAGVLLAATLASNAVYFVVLSRALARPRAQLSSFPADLITRRLGRASLTMLVCGCLVFLAVVIGFAFLFLPGLFLSACFFFVIFAVGVEDRGTVGSLERSWSLSRGNRLRLVGMVLLVGAGSTAVSIVPTLLRTASAPVVGDVATILLNGVLFVFVYGIMAEAYLQVTESDRDRGGTNTAATADGRRSPEV